MKPYDRQTEAGRRPLAERLLAVAALVVLWVLISAVVAWGAAADPARAFPSETLLYLDMRQPVSTLDTLSGTPPWPAVRELVGAFADTGTGVDGGVAAVQQLLSAWSDDVQLHEQLSALAGQRLLFALVAGAAGAPPLPVVALRGGSSAAQLEALGALLERLDRQATGGIHWTGDAFEITAADGAPLLEIRTAGGWLLLGPAGSGGPLPAIARGLSSGEVGPGSLAALQEYADAMARLPDAPAVRGFLNAPAMAARGAALPGLPAPAASLVGEALGCFEGLGFSREIDPLTIRTRVAGRLAANPPDGPLCRLLDSLVPLAEPLSRRLPARALATHDLGTSPGALFGLLAEVLKVAGGRDSTGLSSFGESSGLDPKTDLFPYLGQPVASALLPAPTVPGEPSLPRPVALARTSDGPMVSTFLDAALRWEAGEITARSEGLVSATVVSETHEGTDIRGLQIESLVPGALPSPSYTVAGGLLVVSPVRSAVRDVVSSIHATAGAVASPIEGSPVELFHGDLCAITGQLGPALSSLVSRLSEAGRVSVIGGRLDRLTRLVPPLLALMGSLGQADGRADIGADGLFDATFELHPQDCVTEAGGSQATRPAARRARPAVAE